MTIKHLFYHLLHFIGIGRFYIVEIKRPNFATNTTTVETYKGFSYHKDIEGMIHNEIIEHYGQLALCL